MVPTPIRTTAATVNSLQSIFRLKMSGSRNPINMGLVASIVNATLTLLIFMEAMAHPDGGVSFFNDSVDGIAPTKAKIET